MRQIGNITSEPAAQRFADYLFTLGMTAKAERDGETWAIWVRDEEHVARAGQELAAFVNQPEDSKYSAASTAAKARRDELERREQQARRNFVDMRRRWDARPTGPTPVTMGVVLVCVVVAVLTNLGGQYTQREDGPAVGLVNRLLLVPLIQTEESVSDDGQGDLRETAGDRARTAEHMRWAALRAVRSGEVWRLITPIFLHFGVLHLLFNLSMFYSFGGLIESRRGSIRLAILILVSAALSNLGQFYFPSLGDPARAYYPFGGMSGVLYALFGYIWMKSRYEPASELFVHPNTVVLLMIWLVICMLGVIEHVANWAHGIGLAVGMLVGVAPFAWRKTLLFFKRRGE